MQRSIGRLLAVLFGIWASTVASAYGAAGDDVKWLVVYEGGALPAAPQWTRQGGGVPTSVNDGAMRLVDDSAESFGCYRASFSADPADEIVVEARVRVVSLPDGGDGGLIWPWRDGVPAGILVSDGRHQEGLVLRPTRIATFMDRFHAMDATDKFHDYRLVIRGNDMSVYVDGQLRIRGQDAFWKPATEAKPFIQFGSSSAKHRGESRWEYVKLGVRPAGQAEAKPKWKITVGEPWNVSKQGVAAQTRPYLYNVGKGLLLMSVAQGPDALYEPYGVLKSTDEGKTWSFVEGMREKVFAPQPMTRMQDGSILGASRWMTHYVGDNGVHAGITYHFDPNVESHRMFESKIVLPNEVSNTAAVCDRDIFNLEDGSVVIVIYGSPGAYLVRTTDRGRTWEFYATIAKSAGPEFGEPGVARISDKEWTAVLRRDSMAGLLQVWSHDGGKTWGPPVDLEEGSVDPNLIVMSSGVLACSYGRPGSCIMFSADRGKTWDCHRVISDLVGYNYTAICEVRPGRLLYVHDAPNLTALYLDVEKESD